MKKLCILNKMKKEQAAAYNEWKTKKAEIAELQKSIRVLEAEKKRLVGIFDGAFNSDNTVVGPGGIKVIKMEEERKVEAYSYTLTQYKEG